jgi:hypothetical protein
MGTCSSDTGQLAGSWGSSAVPGRVGARTISCPLTPGGNPPSSVAAAKKHHKEGTGQPGLWVGVLEGQNHLDARAGVPPGRETGRIHTHSFPGSWLVPASGTVAKDCPSTRTAFPAPPAPPSSPAFLWVSWGQGLSPPSPAHCWDGLSRSPTTPVPWLRLVGMSWPLGPSLQKNGFPMTKQWGN